MIFGHTNRVSVSWLPEVSLVKVAPPLFSSEAYWRTSARFSVMV